MLGDKSIYKDKKPWFYIMLFVLIATGIIGGFLLYRAMNKPAEVQGTSQTIAETQQGVKIAANKAGYRLDDGQAKEISTTIREIRTTEKEPVYIVQTTGKDVKKDSEQARRDNKADFAIVTDKDNPDKVVDLNSIEKDSKVELQQYNIQAYKPVIRTISIAPDFNGKAVKQADFTISKKITKDGQYLGVGVGYDFEDKKALVKFSYSW